MAISHAIVLPSRDFAQWLDAARPYINAFDRVAVIRSPAGNDLNRFRNITAVQAPLEWRDDDALNHIRRIYPSVVRVDVIDVNTPDQLRAVLQTRIQRDDRYGETDNFPRHIFDRFILNWPTTARPSRIEKPFSASGGDKNMGFDVTAPAGTQITVAAPGTVSRIVPNNDALNIGPYLQITTPYEGRTYVTTYGGVDASVPLNRPLSAGDVIGTARGPVVRIVLQDFPDGGMGGFALPNVVDPTFMIYRQGLRLRPTVSGLRVRARNNLQSEVVGQVSPGDVIESREIHGRTLAKVGAVGEWMRVYVPGARDAYIAAWFLEAFSIDEAASAIPDVPLPGVNLDIDHPRGRPEPRTLANLGWARMAYNVSLNPTKPEGDPNRYGNTDTGFTFNRYKPYLEACRQAGLKTILVLTHQTFGEGQGYVWHQMDRGKWRDHAAKYHEIVRQIARQFAGTGLVTAYQIWNEQDTQQGEERAAVPMPVEDYAHLLGGAIQAIRESDREAFVITGGHISGDVTGVNYAKRTLQLLPGGVRPDGIAFHPYGKGPDGSPFAPFGPMDGIINRFARVMPDQPLWITEWGVLDRQGQNNIAGQVTQYATTNLNTMRLGFPGMIACACWYAYADGMDNGYGLVTFRNQPKQPLYDSYLK